MWKRKKIVVLFMSLFFILIFISSRNRYLAMSSKDRKVCKYLLLCSKMNKSRQQSKYTSDTEEHNNKNTKNTRNNDLDDSEYKECRNNQNNELSTQVHDVIQHEARVSNKPTLAIGILSYSEFSYRRKVIRNTWLSLTNDAPFDIKYKFLIDRPTNATEQERKCHQDIFYLNVESSTYASQYSEKMLSWMQFALHNYPTAKLIAKCDDDVYVCTSIFERIYKIMNDKLYYGFQHDIYQKRFVVETRIDEMFIVLGRELVERFVTQKFCGTDTGYSKRSCDYADVAIAEWMIKNKVKVDKKNDNAKFIHFDRYVKLDYKMFMLRATRSNFCENNYLFHAASPTVMYRLNYLNKISNSSITENTEVQAPPIAVECNDPNVKMAVKIPSCKIWCITRYRPTSIVKRIVSLKTWCLVIIGDQYLQHKDMYMKKLIHYDPELVHFLGPKEHEEMFPALSEALHWNHFGRQSIGYVYALQRKAEYIIDVDNFGVNDLNTLLSLGTSEEPINHINLCDSSSNINERNQSNDVNYAKKVRNTWPTSIGKFNVSQRLCVSKSTVKAGVLKFIPVYNSDLRHWLPFISTGGFGTADNRYIWLPSSFRYVGLPISVNETWSRNLRKLIVDFFLESNGLKTIYIPSRKSRTSGGTAVHDINFQDSQVRKILQKLKFKLKAVVDVEDVYMELFKHGLIGYDDIAFSRAWTKTLDVIHKTQ